jgi:hypothetical protein
VKPEQASKVTMKGGSGNWGRPVRCEGSGLNVAFRRRHWRESDRVIRPLKPGNAGGGKDPDFWRAFEDGEVKVIGDEPGNTDYDPGPSEKAVSRGEGRRTHVAQVTLAVSDLFRVPHGEASRRAGCGKSARPVR